MTPLGSHHSGLHNSLHSGFFWRRLRAVLLSSFALLASALAAPALAEVALPALSGRVMDLAGLLDTSEQQALQAKLAAFERKSGTQIVVLLIDSTQPEDIFSYTQRLGDAWKLGRKTQGDGLLIVVAKKDRKLRIATSKALEGVLPDLVVKRVIDYGMAPAFKRGDYAAGLNAATDQLIGLLDERSSSSTSADASSGVWQSTTPSSDSGVAYHIPNTLPAGDPSSASAQDSQASDDSPESAPSPESSPSFPFDRSVKYLFGTLPVEALLYIVVPIWPALFRVLAAVLGRKPTALASGAVMGAIVWLSTSTPWLTVLVSLGFVVFSLLFTVKKLSPENPSQRRGRERSGSRSSDRGWSSSSSSSSSRSSSSSSSSSGGGGDFGGGGASGSW